ncbi:MAG: eIF2A-related protein [Limnospira sp.]
MSDPFTLSQTPTQNERSLARLARAICLSQGQFSLILACCNYARLQRQIIKQLQEQLSDGETGQKSLKIQTLTLSPDVTTLYTTLQDAIADPPPSALIVTGLDGVKSLETLLSSTNQVRDEFRKTFSFPLVLWVADNSAKKLIRLAPDFKSWAAATINFEMATPQLLQFLSLQAHTLFSLAELRIRDWEPKNPGSGGSYRPPKYDFALGSRRRRELEATWNDCNRRGIDLDPFLEASRQFIFGLDCDGLDEEDRARQHYQRSLACLQNADPETGPRPISHRERQGIVRFHIALTDRLQAARTPAADRPFLLAAKTHLEQCRDIFAATGRPDLVAGVIYHLGDVLKRLQQWDELQILAETGLKMHLSYGPDRQLARDYGFMAEVALKGGAWNKALEMAKLALAILSDGDCHSERGAYLLLLARSYRHLDRWEQAIRELETARHSTSPAYDPQLYIDILAELRDLYYRHGQYLQAFRIKKRQREIEHQYGFRAFIGVHQLQPPKQAINPAGVGWKAETAIARDLTVSSREQDIDNLIRRLGRDDHKLIILHGRSGVGKSSLIDAGLVPALQPISLGARNLLPVVVRSYTDWVRELESALALALLGQDHLELKDTNLKRLWYRTIAQASQHAWEKGGGDRTAYILHPESFVLDRLQKNADNNLLSVLIFDQFEEFFFASRERASRQTFYEFLRICLNIPFVKVILCMQESCLHYLLECETLCSLDAVNNNILDKQVRYHLRDFSKAEARIAIERLTGRAKFELETALIEQLVEDLADDRHEIRPIELQVVGSQLQEEGEGGIRTLRDYQRLGPDPKATLIGRSIDAIVGDCGSENAEVAWEVLFALTDDKLGRPIKTRSELTAPLHGAPSLPHSFIDIILESGLLLRHREEPEDRYQLMHDYLVMPIRSRYAILDRQRQGTIQKRLQQAQMAKKKAEAAQKLSQEQLIHRNRLLKQLLCIALAAVVGLGISTKVAYQQKRLAYITSLTATSDALFFSHYHFDAMLESLKAARQLKRLQRLTWGGSTLRDAQMRVAATLGQAVYGTHERNRLQGHGDVIWDVAFSPSGDRLASASVDRTIKLWTPEGEAIATLEGHGKSVSGLDFSPDGRMLASASHDKTVKLWSRDGEPLQTLIGHEDIVSAVRFSPNGEVLASASKDGTVKLWSLEGEILKTLQFPNLPLKWLDFSPDGRIVAVVGDGPQVYLFDRRTGRLMRLNHCPPRDECTIYTVDFSADGSRIATGGTDSTVKLWDRRGGLLGVLEGHSGDVYSVTFSPQGWMVATGGHDKTVRLWSEDGELLQVFRGHGDKVTRVNFSPDGYTLASASYDKTVKLWHLENHPLDILEGHRHRVLDVSFSPDARIVASASQDGTVKLWSRSGRLLQTLLGHSDRVAGVSFSPDGQWVATAGYDNSVKLWRRLDGDRNSGRWGSEKVSRGRRISKGDPWAASDAIVASEPVKTLVAHGDSVMSVNFSSDSRYMVTGSKDRTVKLWTADGRLLRTLNGHQGWVNQVSFSPDGGTIASASDDGTVRLWNLQGKQLKTIKVSDSYVLGVSFSPDGKLLATAGYDNKVKLWSRDGVWLNTLLKGTSDSVTDVAFSPDGRLVTSASYDGYIRIWSTWDGTLLKTFKGHGDSVMGLSFSPDGRTLASASRDQTVILWNLDLDDLMHKACDWLQDYLKTNRNLSDRDRRLCGKF